MKHLLNDLTENEKNSIREQHTGGMKVITENFSKLINAKSGNVKPLVNEREGEDYSDLENKDENMIHIPKEFHVLRREMGTKATPKDIIDTYNKIVEEGTPLVSYSNGVFYNEDDEEIPVDVALDELNYQFSGDEGEIDYDDDEEDDMPSYKTKWSEPSDDDM